MRMQFMTNTATLALVSAAVFSTLCLVPSVAQAQSPQTTPQTIGTGAGVLDTGAWTVTPFVGSAFSGDLDSATSVFGLAGGYNWRPQISLEAAFSTLPSSEAGGLIEVDSSLWSLTGNMLYHYNKRPYVPYATVGLGIGHGSVDVESNDPLLVLADHSDTRFVFNFGGGVERNIRARTALRADLRYFFGGDLVPDYWRLAAGLRFTIGGR